MTGLLERDLFSVAAVASGIAAVLWYLASTIEIRAFPRYRFRIRIRGVRPDLSAKEEVSTWTPVGGAPSALPAMQPTRKRAIFSGTRPTVGWSRSLQD